MTQLAYTTGNPANLTGGAPASMNDIQGPLNDIKTYLNGSNVDDGRLTSPNNATWRTLAETPFYITAGTGPVACYISSGGGQTGLAIASGGGGFPAPINLDPAEFAVTSKTAKLRLRVNLISGLAPGVGFTFGVYAISALSGVANQVNVTLGAVVAGSTATIGAIVGAANAVAQTSGTFDFPAPAGQYLFGVNPAGSTAANSIVTGRMQLSISHV